MSSFGWLRIPLEDIIVATNNFAEENLLKGDGKEDVYKGLLLRFNVQMDVAIRKLTRLSDDFYQEINMLSQFRHRNAVSLIGFCDEKCERMIVMEYVVNGSLDNYLTSLTWSQRLHICFGAASTLVDLDKDTIYTKYCLKRRRFKVLLDKDWEAKVLFSISAKWYGTKYSDMYYCLGVILLEVLYGRRVTIELVKQYQAKNHYETGKQHLDMIDPILRRQMLPESLSIVSEIAYDCLKEKSYYRTSDMSQNRTRLQKAFEIQWKHENLLRVENFVKIPLIQIKLATDNFTHKYRYKAHPYDGVYIGELNHFDREHALVNEGENKSEPPKKRSVIIKRFPEYRNITMASIIEELEMYTSWKHPNLLGTLLGYCDEDSDMLLVFEGDFQETLDDYLRSTTNQNWEQLIRICLDIAQGLKYLHTMKGKSSMRHQVIQISNVLLQDNRTAKIANFRSHGLSSFGRTLWQKQPQNFRTFWDAIDASWVPSGQRLFLDDIYSLGVIFFEILDRGLALPHDGSYSGYDPEYLAQQRLRKRMKEFMMLSNYVTEEAQESSYALTAMKSSTLNGALNQDAYDTFFKIASQCMQGIPSERPTIEVVIDSLNKALHFQVKENLKIPLEVIRSATENFNDTYRIGLGGYGIVYKAELSHVHIRSSMVEEKKSKCDLSKKPYTVAIKNILTRGDDQGKEGFDVEVDVLCRCEHPNIVPLLGFCDESDVMLLVYEYAPNGSLDDYLGSTDNNIILTWAQRLKMCIDIAQGLSYLHKKMETKGRVIHRDIKSANILLGVHWEAKIADFGLSKFHPVIQQKSTIITNTIAGTDVYMDPEYAMTRKLKKESDIYSFGVVLFEIFSGTLAYDSKYTSKNEKGIAPIARRHFKRGTLKEILDPKILNEANDELEFILEVGPDRDSLDAFSEIAYKCISKSQAERPTISVIISKLEEALYYQENRMKTLKISLERIKLGVQNFSDGNYIMRGGYGMLYRGKLLYDINEHKKVVVKRFSHDRYLNGVKFSWEPGFLKEIEVLIKYKQENIIGLEGYCKEKDEKIIVYEQDFLRSLNMHLENASLSWTKRLKICIDIAKGLKFLHGSDVGQDVVIHRDIKSSNILLTKDWKAKICGFEHAATYPANKEIEYAIDDVAGSPGYCDPLYSETHILTKESDIYSFGVILFEILCGRLACPHNFRDHSQFLDTLVKQHFQVARLDEIVFGGIKEQMVMQSLATFRRIAFQCLHEEREKRPMAGDVLIELQKALKLQEAYEREEAELHKHYVETLKLSKSPNIFSQMVKTYINDILSKGILLEDDKREIIWDIQQTMLVTDLEESVQRIQEEEDSHLEHYPKKKNIVI